MKTKTRAAVSNLSWFNGGWECGWDLPSNPVSLGVCCIFSRSKNAAGAGLTKDSSEVESLASGTTSDQQTVTDEKLKGRALAGKFLLSWFLDGHHQKRLRATKNKGHLLGHETSCEPWNIVVMTFFVKSNHLWHVWTGGRHFMKLMGSKAGTSIVVQHGELFDHLVTYHHLYLWLSQKIIAFPRFSVCQASSRCVLVGYFKHVAILGWSTPVSHPTSPTGPVAHIWPRLKTCWSQQARLGVKLSGAVFFIIYFYQVDHQSLGNGPVIVDPPLHWSYTLIFV